MTHEKIYQLLLKEDEITWQSILKDLVKSGEIDPWDIDISLLAQRYIETIRTLQEMNLFVSGKVLLASALLLRMKSDKLLHEDFAAFDNILYPPQPDVFDDEDFLTRNQESLIDAEPKLTIKTPQTRKRRVTVDDLMGALEKALEVNKRRIIRDEYRNRVPEDLVVPEKPVDITSLVKNLYFKIKGWFTSNDKLTFDDLLPSNSKEDKILTFIPLLNLDTSGDIDLSQEEPFGTIDVKLLSSELKFSIEKKAEN